MTRAESLQDVIEIGTDAADAIMVKQAGGEIRSSYLVADRYERSGGRTGRPRRKR